MGRKINMAVFVILCLLISSLFIFTIIVLNNESKSKVNKSEKKKDFKEENEVQNKDVGRRYYD